MQSILLFPLNFTWRAEDARWETNRAFWESTCCLTDSSLGKHFSVQKSQRHHLSKNCSRKAKILAPKSREQGWYFLLFATERKKSQKHCFFSSWMCHALQQPSPTHCMVLGKHTGTIHCHLWAQALQHHAQPHSSTASHGFCWGCAHCYSFKCSQIKPVILISTDLYQLQCQQSGKNYPEQTYCLCGVFSFFQAIWKYRACISLPDALASLSQHNALHHPLRNRNCTSWEQQSRHQLSAPSSHHSPAERCSTAHILTEGSAHQKLLLPQSSLRWFLCATSSTEGQTYKQQLLAAASVWWCNVQLSWGWQHSILSTGASNNWLLCYQCFKDPSNSSCF